MSWEIELIHMADRIAEGEARVNDQQRLIQQLAACGQDTAEAEKTLKLMLIIVETMRRHKVAMEFHLMGRNRQ